jgi:hypothetical protein
LVHKQTLELQGLALPVPLLAQMDCFMLAILEVRLK